MNEMEIKKLRELSLNNDLEFNLISKILDGGSNCKKIEIINKKFVLEISFGEEDMWSYFLKTKSDYLITKLLDETNLNLTVDNLNFEYSDTSVDEENNLTLNEILLAIEDIFVYKVNG